jgi:hypothetical protein
MARTVDDAAPHRWVSEAMDLAERFELALFLPRPVPLITVLPVCSAGLLRSEPAAGHFKAAIAPRSGRNPPTPRKAGPRSAQTSKGWRRLSASQPRSPGRFRTLKRPASAGSL